MTLKPDRVQLHHSLDYFCNQTATAGGIVSVSTLGSGAGIDQSVMVCHYAGTASGAKPLGVLLNDVVNIDLTRQKLNPYKDEVQLGNKVTLLMKGEVVTDVLTSGITVANGDHAYLGADGRITNVNTGAVASPRIGSFLTKKDEDGFARVAVNLP